MGGFSIFRSRCLAVRIPLVALGALIAALIFSACGSSSSESAASAEPNNLLAPSELTHFPPGSVQRAFLNFWSDLQFQSWADAVAYYDPGFRDFVGTAAVIGAKKLNGSNYPLLKPEIARVGNGRGETTVYYTLRLADGSKELASVTWRKEGGNWQIVYDSRLNSELAQLEQDRVEIEKNGSLPTDPNQPPSPAAARAANGASELQARFRQQDLRSEG
jgi:hypothetical protein